MRAQKSFLFAVSCLFLVSIAAISPAQQTLDDLVAIHVGAGANLVVTSVAGPVTALHNQKISVTYTVKNQGDAVSGSYQVGLYLSRDNKIDPATDRLLGNVTVSTGLEPGLSQKTTSKVLVPIDGLSGKYYYGAVVASSKKASSKQVYLVRYSPNNDDTVTDHKTGFTWQTADYGPLGSWADANQYCVDLVLGGYDDWRLPRLDELQTIVDYSRSHPAIDPVFAVDPTPGYWTSTTIVGYPDHAWYMEFSQGLVGGAPKAGAGGYVRCVRGGSW